MAFARPDDLFRHVCANFVTRPVLLYKTVDRYVLTSFFTAHTRQISYYLPSYRHQQHKTEKNPPPPLLSCVWFFAYSTMYQNTGINFPVGV